jgi:hypothetical protein
MQSACSIAVVTHALIVASGDVALARRYLTNSEKVVDEMLLMTYEQDKWLIQHGKQQQQAALDGAPVALVSDSDAIKLQVMRASFRVASSGRVRDSSLPEHRPSRRQRALVVAERRQMIHTPSACRRSLRRSMTQRPMTRSRAFKCSLTAPVCYSCTPETDPFDRFRL